MYVFAYTYTYLYMYTHIIHLNCTPKVFCDSACVIEFTHSIYAAHYTCVIQYSCALYHIR